MGRFRMLGVTALAVLALGAIVATAAQATEGPFYKICTKVPAGTGKFESAACVTEGGGKEFEKLALREGSPAVEGAVVTAFKLVGPGGTVKITCNKQKLENAALVGAAKGNAGTSVETIVFEECKVEGNGASCEPFSEQFESKKELGVIRSVPVTNTLDYPKEKPAKGDVVLVLFQPVKGTVFSNIKFTGTACNAASIAVEGSVAGEAQTSTGVHVTVEETEPIEEKGRVNFPSTLIKADWVEEGGKTKEVKPSLKVAGVAAEKFTGTSEVKLSGKQAWGVVTK